jgi:hypothetical protein
MKKKDVHVGATYQVKVGGNLVPVTIEREHDSGGWVGRSAKTGKQIRIKSPQRLRRRLADREQRAMAESGPKGTKRIVSKAEYESNATPSADTGQRDAVGAKADGRKLSLIQAAAIVLEVCDQPMSCKEIVEKAIDAGAWTPGRGKTPANTLYSAILRETKTKGDEARFVKVERGKFMLNR